MKKTTKILSLFLVCALVVTCAVYFMPSSSVEAESITKNLWSIQDSYLSNYQNVKLDTNPNKKTDTVDFSISGSGEGATSNFSVVNGATYTASCIYSFDGYQATRRRFVFLVYCYDRNGNKLVSNGLISGLDYDNYYEAYGVSYAGNSSVTTDFDYSVNFTINSINISYIAVKFGIYDSDLQTGATIKFPMVELGNIKTEYVKSDKGYDSGYIDGKISTYDVLNPCSVFLHSAKFITNPGEWSLTRTEASFLDKNNWVDSPSWRAFDGSTSVNKSGYFSTYTSILNASGYGYRVQDVYSLGSMTYEQFIESDLETIYYCTDEIDQGGFNSCIEIRKTNYQSFQEALEDSYKLGSQNGYEAGKQFETDLVRSEGYASGYQDGTTKGYQDGLRDGEGALSIGVGTVSTMFSGMASLLNVKVFGTVPLGAFLGIPLLFGLVLFVLKIVRG